MIEHQRPPLDPAPASAIRRADPREAPLLSELALRSKAYWGYDPAFLAACRPLLIISPEYVAASPVYVAALETAAGEQIAGFYGLADLGTDDRGRTQADLAYLFVAPEAIGRGHGRRLWDHAVATCRRLGFARLVIESDPNAEPFYRAVGARRVGETASPALPGRRLPLLHYDIEPDSVPDSG